MVDDPDRRNWVKSHTRRNWLKRHKILTAAVGLGALVVIGIIVAAQSAQNTKQLSAESASAITSGTNSSSSDDGSADNAGITSGTSNTSTTTPNPTASSPPTTAQQITTWDQSYGSSFTTLANDMSATGTDASNEDLTALAIDCQKLQTDITTAQDDPAIPSETIEQHYSSALSYYSSGAQDCVQGVANVDANQLDQAASEFTQGTTQIEAATQALQQYE